MNVRLLLVLFLISASGIEAKQYACVCNDGKSVIPDCGICGREAGTMLLTDDGVECICENGLTLNKISCATACKLNNGWSGNVK